MKVVSLTLETNILFLPTISSPNQTFKLIEYGECHQLKKLLIVRQNSPCHYHWKCQENSDENMDTCVKKI